MEGKILAKTNEPATAYFVAKKPLNFFVKKEGEN